MTMRQQDATIGQWVRYDDEPGIIAGEPVLVRINPADDDHPQYIAQCEVFWPAVGKMTTSWLSDLSPIKWHTAREMTRRAIKAREDHAAGPSPVAAVDVRAKAECPVCGQRITVLAGLYANHGTSLGSPIRCSMSGEPVAS